MVISLPFFRCFWLAWQNPTQESAYIYDTNWERRGKFELAWSRHIAGIATAMSTAGFNDLQTPTTLMYRDDFLRKEGKKCMHILTQKYIGKSKFSYVVRIVAFKSEQICNMIFTDYLHNLIFIRLSAHTWNEKLRVEQRTKKHINLTHKLC